jgi:hypothetical protein
VFIQPQSCCFAPLSLQLCLLRVRLTSVREQ